MPNINPGAEAFFLTEVNGVRFYRIPSEKFKTTRVDVYIADRLSSERAAANALVPKLMGRGCAPYPTMLALERAQERLYGASFTSEIMKRGEAQVLHASMTQIQDSFASGSEPLFREAGRLLCDILFQPVFENGMFPAEPLRQERENLVNDIESRINDKIRYAMLRCTEEMCRGEAFAVHSEGDLEQALALTGETVTERWRTMTASLPCFVYISGNVADEAVQAFIAAFSASSGDHREPRPVTKPGHMPASVRVIEESMDVNQAKLCMGLRTSTAGDSADWPAMMAYNGILGGDLHSKLFQNVREKASLAYYASSRPERMKQLLYINSGIEAANREAAEEIILRQLADMRDGSITDDEFSATIRSLETAMRMARDSQSGIADFHFGQHLAGLSDTFDSLTEAIRLVKPEDVVRVAAGVKLDTVYFLKPGKTQE